MKRAGTWLAILAAVLAAGLCSGQAWGATIQSAGTGMWTNGATWVGNVAPGSGDDAVITNGCTVTMNDMVTREVKSLTIQSGGKLTHTMGYDSELYKVIINATDGLTIDSGGAIDVDGMGYRYYYGGPGAPGSGASGGGSHGGKGGQDSGTTYGSIMAPVNWGSGGKEGWTPGYGGGAVILTVGGTATVNGQILARGTADSGRNQGAGGSVFLTTGSLIGNGTIDAGTQSSSPYASGGGGRIAVILTNSTDFGGVALRARSQAGSYSTGAGGTVYLQHPNHTANEGILIVDYGSVTASSISYNTMQNGYAASSNAFSEIVLTNGAVYALDTNDTLNITATTVQGSPANRNEGFYVNGGTLTVPSSFGFTNYFIRIAHTNTVFAPTSLTVGTNATLQFDVPWTRNTPTVEPGGELTINKPVVLNGSLTIPAGVVMNHSGNYGAETWKLDLTLAGDLAVAVGGAIDVDGRGYSGYNNGPGAPAVGAGDGAGSHGGMGAGVTGKAYGSITAPTNCGSTAKEGWNGSYGGGAAILKVSGTTTLNGSILARGKRGASGHQAAGGSVFLTTAGLSGAGTIDAGTLNESGTYYSGGGGRIAVIVTNDTGFGSVVMRVQSCSGSSGNGAGGTIYRQHKGHGPGAGDLIVDSSLAPYSALGTLIDGDVSGTEVGTVIVTNAARLVVSNQTLTINGSLENTATFIGLLNSTVRFQGTNAARILSSNSNTFYNLVCTNIGETLSFQDVRTNTVNGILTLANITLNSISGGQWFLKASPSTHNVTNVNVSRSDARPGSAIEAFDSVNGGNNYNWVFAESGFCTNYWTGTEDSDWTKTNNWSRGRSSQLSDTVVVTNGCTNYPLLQSATRILSLVVSNGASVGLNNYNLVLDGDLRVGGTLTASGTETVTLRGNVDFSGGTFNAAASTVWLAGTNTQTVASGGIAFRNLTISNSAASVMFTDAVTATNIVNHSTPITFGGAVTARSSIWTVGTNVIFGGAVNVPLLYNETGALVFSGTVATAVFTNQSGNLTFRNDFASDRFYCAPGGMNLTFEAGKTYTFGDLLLYGQAGNRIRLRSSEAASWNLNVTSSHTVRLVDVEYSDASSGQTIYPLGSIDGDHNTNWVFGGPWQAWVGSASGSFTNGSNWDPAGAPDSAGTHLLVCDYTQNAPVLSNSVSATVGRLTVGGGITLATLTVNGHLTTIGDADVLSKGKITHSSNYSTEAYKLYMTVGGSLNIQANGAIDVDGMGYSYYYGGLGAPGESQNGSGSHGGKGTGSTGATYGSITSPTNCGSAGKDGWTPGNGGGVAVLAVAGATTVNGQILARGTHTACQGAGGSVFLTTGTLTGSGTIDAGTLNNNPMYAAGGGRVAVILTNGTDLGSVSLRACSASSWYSQSGSPGTVYTQTKDQGAGRGTLLIHANGIAPTAPSTTLIGSNVTGTTVGTVIITNQAILRIDTNQSLTVNGNWLNAATFIAASNSTVVLADAAAATVMTSSSNTFYNLTCTNAGKVLSFQAGRTNTVNGLLRLGASQPGQMVTLQSTVGGSWSYLTLVSGGTQAIARVNVKDNNAGGGQTLLAGVGSANGGNNINWQFPPSGTMFMVK